MKKKDIYFILSSLAPLSVLTVLLIGVYLFPYLSSVPDPILDLTQQHWKACFPGEDASCTYFDTNVPKDVRVGLDSRFSGSVQYFTKFLTPRECLDSEKGCSLFISEIGDAAVFRFNGIQVGKHGALPPQGRYAKHYPASISLPREVFSEGINTLEIKVHSFKNVQAGIRKGPVALFTDEAAYRLSRVRIAQSIIVPLISSFVVFLVALFSVAWAMTRREVSNEVKRLIYYCVSVSFFLFSFTELPREVIPVHWAGLIHHSARLLGDLMYFELMRVCFFPAVGFLKRFRIVYLLVLLICPIVAMFYWADGTWAIHGFDNTYNVRRAAVPLLVLPHILGILGALSLPKSRLRLVFATIFVLTAYFQISDSLIFHAVSSGTYYVKAYPVLIAFGMAYYVFRRRIQAILTELSQLRADSLVGVIAAQVAHDIRSPLAALAVVESELNEIPEDTRTLLKSAVGRIREIANQLLEKRSVANVTSSSEPCKAHLLSGLLEEIVHEKRVQFRNHADVEIESDLSLSSDEFFAKVQAGEFKRVVSNLINNGVEALEGGGRVVARLKSRGNKILLQVEDNGRGISKDVIHKLGRYGETFGKEGGTGLGLFHAFSTVDSWGGHLEIFSEIGKGTSVALTLPKTSTSNYTQASYPSSPEPQAGYCRESRRTTPPWRSVESP